jgi:ribonuclease HII
VYGFDRHKGYSTRGHMRALANHGPCPQHRVSFANVQGLAAGALDSLDGPDRLAGPDSSADVPMIDRAAGGVAVPAMSGQLMRGELTYG